MNLNKQQINVKSFLINEENEGIRIDKFLKAQFPEISRNRLQALIKQGFVLIEGKTTKPRYLLRKNDKLKVHLQPKKEVKISPNPKVKLDILFENEHFLVLNKAAKILVHPAKTPTTKTLANGLVSYLPSLRKVGENPLRPGIVHRLDKDTSGLLLVAKNQKAFLELKRLFQKRKIEKEYLALVAGKFRHKKGKIESYLIRSRNHASKRISLPLPAENAKSKKALTFYQVKKEFHPLKGHYYTLLSLFPKTGRTHQLRAQLSSINHPIVGDPLYKSKTGQSLLAPPQMFLHAAKLAFFFQNQYYQFYSPLPRALQDFLSSLKQC